ncbi:DUF58 domain-containing protein [Cellulomonas fimi]|uniref:DUF58 domain-containing protein n=1 Tax=Cellulomonas fimi (strain ATCC 484 / DSM 20113 / JCM 1341 / CCUG 24087 / LMG 16345 / NBRC 15513 / NCIMB 8980 / NCTC 7547 / NRS-133) TaxID=590998 RepID=F4H4C8_CELFA|nr:DUF58 domain-containing protein [Cellulomonas fimi]AEE46604.1 protein of unknown function DUF58 [Cellulomonas fimi ATCC 484]NNH08855.1 DUF58 domain-containing protein [Cellulomonas fimi]VEH33642.1 Uncharacterized conserved protein (some members contain a von Willebrand factor type A (vWA) domain) [Cellulomonas fimi]
MTLTWRAVALVAAGVPVLLLLPSTGTVLVWGLVCLALCVLDALLAASPRQVAVRRDVPQSVRLTEQATSTLTLTNVGSRRLRGLVRDAWPPSASAVQDRHRVDVPAGDGVRVRTVLRPTRRGDAHADRVTVRASGPLGLAGRQASLTVPGRLRVLPEFASRRHLPSRLARLREMDGRAAVQVRGPGTEFDSLREYVIGDDVRAIDWRATARRGDVVVRTWRPERDRRVLIVLDTGRTSAVRVLDAPRLDASIEAALLLSALATRAGDRVELLAYDRRARARVAGTAGPRLMPALADALATTAPELVESDWPGVVTQVRSRLSQRALVVLLTSLDAAAVERGLLGVVGQLTSRHQVVLASVADPETAALRADGGDAHTVYDAAAAERAELEREAVAVRLRQRGVEVLDALPDDLAPRLADTYLALKAAGRL